MKWRMFLSTAAVLIFVGMAMSETYTGFITGVKDGKVTFTPGKFNKEEKKFEKGEAMTLPVADDVKISKGKFDKEAQKLVAGHKIEGGLKHEMFDKIDKGIFASITTDKDNKKITEIIVGGFGKKKDK